MSSKKIKLTKDIYICYHEMFKTPKIIVYNFRGTYLL